MFEKNFLRGALGCGSALEFSDRDKGEVIACPTKLTKTSMDSGMSLRFTTSAVTMWQKRKGL
jgi:hypothetical protein